MSRHAITPTNIEIKFVYGYDCPLEEYFWQLWIGHDPDSPIDSGAGTAFKVIEAAARLGVVLPSEHMTLLCLDLPIP